MSSLSPRLAVAFACLSLPAFAASTHTFPENLPPPPTFSIPADEGNHRVTITFGDAHDASDTIVRAESRQFLLERLATAPGEFVTRTFLVNVRTPRIPPPETNAPGGSAVVLNDRERNLLRWDEQLTLEFTGPAPRVRSISIEPAPAGTPTVFLAGDSTVTDQPSEPAASWGQMLPRFFKPSVAIANHAESGETLKTHSSTRPSSGKSAPISG